MPKASKTNRLVKESWDSVNNFQFEIRPESSALSLAVFHVQLEEKDENYPV